jgi:hypothetical protein
VALAVIVFDKVSVTVIVWLPAVVSVVQKAPRA